MYMHIQACIYIIICILCTFNDILSWTDNLALPVKSSCKEIQRTSHYPDILIISMIRIKHHMHWFSYNLYTYPKAFSKFASLPCKVTKSHDHFDLCLIAWRLMNILNLLVVNVRKIPERIREVCKWHSWLVETLVIAWCDWHPNETE